MQRSGMVFLVLFVSLIINGVLAYVYSTSAQEWAREKAALEREIATLKATGGKHP